MTAVPALAGAADLDAPLQPKPPTLRSEIQRGADAAFDCRLANSEHPLDGEFLFHCLDARQIANRQRMGRGYEPFAAGLWYEARDAFRSLIAVAPSDLGSSELDVAVAGLREAERAIGVTDDDVQRAIQRH